MVVIHDNLGPVAGSSAILNSKLNRKHLNICQFNAQSLVPNERSTKFHEVKNLFHNSAYDIVGVTETWFSSSVSSNVLAFDGFRLFRNDRKWHRGGGVCLYVSESIKARMVCDYMEEGVVECLFVEIAMNASEKVLVGIVYLPNGCFVKYEDLLNDLSCRYSNVIIMGDFNTDLFKNSSLIRDFCARSSLAVVHNSLHTHFSRVHNRYSLIDFFFVSDINNVLRKGQFQIPALNSCHALVSLSYRSEVARVNNEIWYRDYRSFNQGLCHSQLDSIDFSEIYSTPQVDEQVRIFNSIIRRVFEDNIPLRKFTQRRSENWLNSREIRNAKSNRDLAWRAYCEDKSEHNRRIYNKHRNKVKSIIRRVRRETCINMFEGCTSQNFWRKLREKGVIGEERVSADLDVEEFNRNSVMAPAPRQIGPLWVASNNNGFTFRNVEVLEVYNAMMKIKSDAVGADGIPLKFLKLIFPKISRPITFILNHIITSSYFPSDWKISKITPVPKTKTPRVLSDYRPISVLCALSKVLEVLLRDQLQAHVNLHNFLSIYQSGFRRHYSTSGLLLDVVEQLRINFDRKLTSVAVFLDFSKAFDSLSHELLCNKLFNQFNVDQPACKLIFSFLSNRHQYVCHKGNKSCELETFRGVPQGSILSPLLFMIYVNDLYKTLKFCKCYNYADDFQLLAVDNDSAPQNLEQNVNEELKRIALWSESNFLYLNPSKTRCMWFSPDLGPEPCLSFDGENLEFVSFYKTLGIFIDNRLSFDYHVNQIVFKVNSVLRRLYNVGIFLPISVKKRVALSLCLPIITYGLEIYSGTSDHNIMRLKQCFNRVLRFIFGLRFRDWTHMTPYVISVLGCDFNDFIRLRLLLQFYKIVKFGAPSYLLNRFSFGHSSRTHSLNFPRYSSLIMNRSFVVRVTRLWNQLIPIKDRAFKGSVANFKRIILSNL